MIALIPVFEVRIGPLHIEAKGLKQSIRHHQCRGWF